MQGLPMPHQNNPDPYVPSDLELVFDSLWREIRPPGLEPLEQARLRLSLARCLVVLSNRGVRDAANLRQRALEYFLPERRSA
jgi:hypothetical protein